MVSFNNKNNFDLYLKKIILFRNGFLVYVILIKRIKLFIKFFMDIFDDEDEGYTADDILKFSGIKNNTFIWP